jgi:hypothetical protein
MPPDHCEVPEDELLGFSGKMSGGLPPKKFMETV